MERRVLVQGTMGPRLIIVGGICAQNPAQVRFTEYDHVVQALPADRADEPLNVSVLPGRSERNRPISNTHGAQALHEDWPVRDVPIPNEVSRRMVPRESLGDLARDPLRSRVFRYPKRQPNSSSMSYDDKAIEDPECDRWKDKKVDRRDAVGMVAQKRAPALRWWPRLAAHIPSDCRLSDIEAELEQLTMNVWGAPERVRPAYLANERAQFSRDLRPADMVARSPAPIRSKSSTVPANDGFWPDNRNRAKDGGKPVIKPNKQKTVGIVEVRSFRCSPAKHIDLLP